MCIRDRATAYKIGMMQILELRARAMKKLGEDFDYGEFHNVILGGGPLPMPVLEARVDAWLSR